uniref:Ribonuclease H-like domain-containing protein n=1 Tax=Tanacetum cinerariifolium TaxID=118510 RepID=A0A699HN78_TANCI|nr:ribonuclease H-like domain-containing protein [Tanacetum cinerariifolium]
MPPKPNSVYPSLDDFVDESVSESIVEKPTVNSNEPKTIRKENRAPIIEDWVSESEEEDEPKSQSVKPNITKIEFVKSKTNRKPVEQIVNAARNFFSKAAVTVNTARPVNTTHPKRTMNAAKPRPKVVLNVVQGNQGNPRHDLKDKGVIDSGCSRHMTGNKSYLTDYEEINGGFVAFGGNSKGGKITGKGKIRTGKLNFKNMYFEKELKFKLFSVSQMCDKKNSVLFTDTACVVLSPNFKLTDESHVLLKVPRKDNMYSVDLKNVIPQRGKFDGKADKGFSVGYSTNSKAFRVFNSRTRIVEENMHVKFSKNTPNIARSRPNWLFDVDALIKSMNYKPVVTGNQSNGSAVTKDSPGAGYKPSGEEE